MEPNKAEQDAYSFFNIRAGVSNDDWTAEVYLDNVTDKRADISNTFVLIDLEWQLSNQELLVLDTRKLSNINY